MSARRILIVLSWACVLSFAFLILSPTVFHAAPQDSGYRVLRTIPLGGEGGWDYVTVDSAARRVYIPRSTHILVIGNVAAGALATIAVPDGALAAYQRLLSLDDLCALGENTLSLSQLEDGLGLDVDAFLDWSQPTVIDG